MSCSAELRMENVNNLGARFMRLVHVAGGWILQNIDFVIQYDIQYCNEEIMKLLAVYNIE